MKSFGGRVSRDSGLTLKKAKWLALNFSKASSLPERNWH